MSGTAVLSEVFILSYILLAYGTFPYCSGSSSQKLLVVCFMQQ